jgi:hypothetical protein
MPKKCHFHFASGILNSERLPRDVQRRLAMRAEALEKGVDVPDDSETDTEVEEGSGRRPSSAGPSSAGPSSAGPSSAGPSSAGPPSGPSPGPSSAGRRVNRPFTRYDSYVYVGRDRSGCEFPPPIERGIRRYVLPEAQLFEVDRTIVGCNRFENMDLLRCWQWYDSTCPVFAYKYRGIIYAYGFHNHA